MNCVNSLRRLALLFNKFIDQLHICSQFFDFFEGFAPYDFFFPSSLLFARLYLLEVEGASN